MSSKITTACFNPEFTIAKSGWILLKKVGLCCSLQVHVCTCNRLQQASCRYSDRLLLWAGRKNHNQFQQSPLSPLPSIVWFLLLQSVLVLVAPQSNIAKRQKTLEAVLVCLPCLLFSLQNCLHLNLMSRAAAQSIYARSAPHRRKVWPIAAKKPACQKGKKAFFCVN